MSVEVGIQGTFLVDTKSTCFFCLEEIYPKSLVITDMDDDEEKVGTTLLEGGNPCSGAVSMEKIFKYLDMEPGVILKRKLTSGLEWAANQLMNTEFKVTVCGECQRVTDGLTTMIEEGQCMEKRIVIGVGRLHELIKHSLDDPSREAAFHEKLKTPEEILYGLIAGGLREVISEKCVEILDKPSVASELERGLQPTVEEDFETLVVQVKFKCQICKIFVESMNSLYDHQWKEHDFRSNHSKASTPKRARRRQSAKNNPFQVGHSVFAHSARVRRNCHKKQKCSFETESPECWPVIVSTFSLADTMQDSNKLERQA